MHFASSRKLNLYKYAFVLPCPDSTAVIFEVRLTFVSSLNYCWEILFCCLCLRCFCPLFLPFSDCFFCCFPVYGTPYVFYCTRIWFRRFSLLFLDNLSAISLPYIFAWALTHENFIFHLALTILVISFRISSAR